MQTATLIIAFGLIVQGYSVWKLRHALDWRKLGRSSQVLRSACRSASPFSAGQIPLMSGPALACSSSSTVSMRCFARAAAGDAGGAAADAAVGFANGVLGGITGLAGILVTIWCGCAAGQDRQRAVFQPVAVAIFAMSALWLGVKGAVSADTIRLFLFGLPALLAGTWLGMKLYGRLDEAAFRKVASLRIKF